MFYNHLYNNYVYYLVIGDFQSALKYYNAMLYAIWENGTEYSIATKEYNMLHKIYVDADKFHFSYFD